MEASATDKDLEEMRVLSWRLEKLLAAGYETSVAFELANDPTVDTTEAVARAQKIGPLAAYLKYY